MLGGVPPGRQVNKTTKQFAQVLGTQALTCPGPRARRIFFVSSFLSFLSSFPSFFFLLSFFLSRQISVDEGPQDASPAVD